MKNFTLSTEQRHDAEQTARSAIAGARPTQQDAPRSVPTYPPTFTRLVVALLCVVLIAAFAVSAMRMYDIAARTFAHGINDTRSAQVAGVAFVVLAETAQVVFLLARAVIARTRLTNALMLFGAALGTCVAIVGNAEAARLNSASYAFPWLDAFVPPLVVFVCAYTLERIMLVSIRERHEAQHAHAQALQDWQQRYDNAHTSDTWRRALLQAYYNALNKAYNRRQGWRNATDEQRRQNALDVLYAGDTFERALQEHDAAQAQQDEQRKADVAHIERTPQRNGSSSGTHTGEVDVHAHSDGYVVECPHCDWRKTYTAQRSAQMGLTAHLGKHRREGVDTLATQNGHAHEHN